jgi:hypothetical protein
MGYPLRPAFLPVMVSTVMRIQQSLIVCADALVVSTSTRPSVRPPYRTHGELSASSCSPILIIPSDLAEFKLSA